MINIAIEMTIEIVCLRIKDGDLPWSKVDLPSGKRLHNYGKSQFLMGKLFINGHFQ